MFLVDLLVLILVIGLIYWIATLLFPHPFPMIVLGVGAIVVLLWLVDVVPGAHFR